MRIGVATAGGDCPGLNAFIRAVVRRSEAAGNQVFGFTNGWEGVVSGEGRPLDHNDVRGILRIGGTMLGSSRYDPYVHGGGADDARSGLAAAGVDVLIVAGGDGTLATALRLSDEGVPIIGVPKTIDRDVPGTEGVIGYSTAVQIVTDTLDRLTTTAESHHRVLLVEVMGRRSGWIATAAGIAGGADHILIPEKSFEIDDVVKTIATRRERGRKHTIVVVAEGIELPADASPEEIKTDAFGFERIGGACHALAPLLEARSGVEARTTVLGYVQRGGNPNAEDRILATRFGVAAADLAASGKSGLMVALRSGTVVGAPLGDVMGDAMRVPEGLISVAETFYT